ncbi:hypothetical protein [Bradyrhizobium sp.]|uniref:hypothetical protein n=1 Tax=Bradyrhizobium sp. TaxID=376 RepID=UPI002D3ED086|nr:hypothetical protein [Bradyrhizobium sp.]HZR74646.1 hypothetical protein [Bradyrhizobium sp.]
MLFRKTVFATAALAALASAGVARAADLPVKAAKPVKDTPFFLVIDDRVTFSYIFSGTDPGAFSVNPNGTFNGKTPKQVYSFTHFDIWGYGTNFFTISMFKSGHNDPASPCVNAGVLMSGAPADCAGATEIYGLFRSTFGWNEIFGTKAFSMGPLHNISFEIGADANSENTFLAPAKRDFVAGLQFAFDLPYKGYINVAPLAYKEINHNAFDQCGLFGPGVPGVTCLSDGNTNYKTTWAVEINYYMDLGFLPENMQYFSVSGRAGWYGPKGDQNSPLVGTGVGSNSTATKTELNSEPIRLTFDASKAAWGAKYTHFVDLWVAYRYWQNKFGLDHNAAPGVCTVNGVSTNSCTESSLYAGVTVKF